VLGVETFGHPEDDDAGVEAVEREYSNQRESRCQRGIQLLVRRRNRQHFTADYGGAVPIGFQGCAVTSEQVAKPQLADVLESRGVELLNGPGEGTVQVGKLGLGQGGQAHIGQADLRMCSLYGYDQQWAANLEYRTLQYRTADRMTALGEDLGEQIVGLLPRLRRFARTLTGSVQDADDLVHVAIERALSRSDQLRPDSAVSSWVFGILRNAWIDEVRARNRRQRVFAPEELGEGVADPSGHRQEDVISVQGALTRLPEEQREVVGLVLVEGLSYKEAADIMNVPVGTVTSRLARGRDALQAMLGTASEGTTQEEVS
jgi:RNA polymerase sigma-70 factor, ECF subfamily